MRSVQCEKLSAWKAAALVQVVGRLVVHPHCHPVTLSSSFCVCVPTPLKVR